MKELNEAYEQINNLSEGRNKHIRKLLAQQKAGDVEGAKRTQEIVAKKLESGSRRFEAHPFFQLHGQEELAKKINTENIPIRFERTIRGAQAAYNLEKLRRKNDERAGIIKPGEPRPPVYALSGEFKPTDIAVRHLSSLGSEAIEKENKDRQAIGLQPWPTVSTQNGTQFDMTSRSLYSPIAGRRLDRLEVMRKLDPGKFASRHANDPDHQMAILKKDAEANRLPAHVISQRLDDVSAAANEKSRQDTEKLKSVGEKISDMMNKLGGIEALSPVPSEPERRSAREDALSARMLGSPEVLHREVDVARGIPPMFRTRIPKRNIQEAGERRLRRLQAALTKQKEARIASKSTPEEMERYRADMKQAQATDSFLAARVRARFASPPGETPQAEQDLQAKIQTGAETLAASRQRRIQAGRGLLGNLAGEVKLRQSLPHLVNDPRTQELSGTLHLLTTPERIADPIVGRNSDSVRELKAKNKWVPSVRKPSQSKKKFSDDMFHTQRMFHTHKMHNLKNKELNEKVSSGGLLDPGGATPIGDSESKALSTGFLGPILVQNPAGAGFDPKAKETRLGMGLKIDAKDYDFAKNFAKQHGIDIDDTTKPWQAMNKARQNERLQMVKQKGVEMGLISPDSGIETMSISQNANPQTVLDSPLNQWLWDNIRNPSIAFAKQNQEVQEEFTVPTQKQNAKAKTNFSSAMGLKVDPQTEKKVKSKIKSTGVKPSGNVYKDLNAAQNRINIVNAIRRSMKGV